jgi:hypothetical protein
LFSTGNERPSQKNMVKFGGVELREFGSDGYRVHDLKPSGLVEAYSHNMVWTLASRRS